MKVLQFYTSTGMRDAERVNSQSGLLCPDWRLLPFQIQRPAAGTSTLSEALLVDCAGATTNILGELTLSNKERTIYDFITYEGESFDQWMDYGTYYIQAGDGTHTWYSEWLNIRNIQPTLLTGWASNTGYAQFTVVPAGSHEDVGIANAVSTAAASALSNPFSVRLGEQLFVTTDYNIATAPVNALLQVVDSGGGVISNNVNPTDGIVQTSGFSIRASDTAAQLKLSNIQTRFSLDRLSLRRYQGNGSYVYMRFDNTKDIQGKTALSYALTPERESILYSATGGFTQEIYLDTYLNNPNHEPIEIGDEKNGVFEAEKIIDKYIYNIIARESRATFNALRLLPMHDNIQIYDEVGNQYLPDQGNVRVNLEWTTFDTGTIRIDFNEDNHVWTNSMDNIV